MVQAYTHTTWRVKPGREEDFVERWIDFADWAGLQGLTAPAKLLRNVDDPSRFVSFGPWRSLEEAHSWRAGEGFHERVSRLQEVLESFEPQTLQLVTEH